jgi:hypothetical protein
MDETSVLEENNVLVPEILANVAWLLAQQIENMLLL